ncbi:MAG: HEAT repeat domain-containing protein [Gammaproteobacteria bacterium]|jgi:glutaredoxin|nr:HEAT repeat domain-containing protein [Gammaproteobacteria bacterium]
MVDDAADATLLIRTSCPHCASVAEAVLRLTKMGKLGRLELINLDLRPEPAQALGARSVPWLKLGRFELVGARSFHELEDWAEHAAAGSGWPEYLLALLSEQQLTRVIALLREHPQHLSDLLDRMTDEQLEMGARIGISAVVEELAETPALRACVPQLIELTLSAYPQTRADACHFLGLAGDPTAAAAVRRLLQDESEDVREIAVETLAVLDGSDDLEESTGC